MEGGRTQKVWGAFYPESAAKTTTLQPLTDTTCIAGCNAASEWKVDCLPPYLALCAISSSVEGQDSQSAILNLELGWYS